MRKKFNILQPATWFGKRFERPEPLAMRRFRNLVDNPVPFTGEINQDLAGPAIQYQQDHYELIVRSWQQLHESDLAQIAIKRLIRWTIGKGLKLQSEPDEEILKEEGIGAFDKKKFTKSFERRFNLWKADKSVHWGGQMTLDELSEEAEFNAVIGGDILVILRVVNGQIKVQHIDGYNVQSPMYGSEWYPQQLPDGHLLIDGVEINERREHVAYWVKVYATEATQDNFNQPYRFERILAKNPDTGFTMAYFYYGLRYRINSVRGWPLIAAMIEKLNSTSQYSTATLNQAKASSKVDYQLVTKENAPGGAPWANLASGAANGMTFENNSLPETEDGVKKGNRTIVTSIGNVYENNPGSEVKVLENKNPLYFKDFYTTHSDVFFAVCEIPPNVAMSKYDQSFSASRMATGDWQNTLIVKRDNHYRGYLKPIVDLWLDLQVLTGKVQAPGYIISRKGRNDEVIKSYRKVRFVGANVPAVDSLKEAQAARVMLGEAGKHLPLNDLENITEMLGGGDSIENLQQFSDELKMADDLKIVPLPVLQQVSGSGQASKKNNENDDSED